MIRAFWCSVLTALVLQAAVDGTNWPKDKYALLKPDTGCPEGWKDKGWLFQDTEDTNPSNNRSEILHIDGYVSPSYVIRSFCVKTTTGQGPDFAPNWPQGRYCIYRKRNESLLTGFEEAEIKMNNEKSSNKDTVMYISFFDWIFYALSDKIYSHLVLYFQCKTDGSTTVPISLPITKPFYLLPYGSRDCQQVKWMVATTEWIKYHTNNYINKTGQTYHNGTAPYHELGEENNKGMTMFYCYYESCNYTLTNKKGVFQSPGFPGEYPDGQLCSWRITVPVNHTLQVHFTNFSLDRNADNLTFFENNSGIFYLNDTFHGHYNQPFNITATSDVLFEFLTNEEGNSTGFRAEYTVFKTSETTPSPQPTTRNTDQHTTLKTNTGVLHTTTIPTTETKNNNGTANTFKKYVVGQCDGTNTTILIVIPLICLIVVIAVVIVILYRWRSKKTICEKCGSTSAECIPIHERTSTATMKTTLGTDDNDGQMHQALSRDNQNSGYSKYHELESMDNKFPGEVSDILPGPDSGEPLDNPMYQAVDHMTIHNPLYQSTQPVTMAMQNPMYDSAA